MSENSTKIIGLFLKELRIRKSISQEGLADITNIKRATIAKIESGESSSTFNTLKKILDALDSNLTEFDEYLKDNTVESQLRSQLDDESDIKKILSEIE